MKVIGVIPARYGSSRLPGKPLIDICGKPMIWWVYDRVHDIRGMTEVYVATDDRRITAVCEDYGIPAVMTSCSHSTGAERLWEVSESISGDFYIQINGDEPLIDAGVIGCAIPSSVPRDREFGTNVITAIKDPSHVMDPSNIKMVFDQEMNALYMSRTPIPYPFKEIGFTYYKHVGVIGYNKKMLDFYKASSPGKLERIEGIDTLRFLDYGKQLSLQIVEECHSLSVDTEKDLMEVRRRIAQMLES